ncbi:MAG TPA: hypothetical protein VJ464_12020 [Blastocatellia bacterium]|nr:hypothetical protein [Blastocatellia bacterium]
MDERGLEFNEVRLAIVNGERHAERAAPIAQLTFAYVQELLERELQQLDADAVIEHLALPPIPVSFDLMDDEAIARASAESIFRAVMAAL